jgi:hypothetical protein
MSKPTKHIGVSPLTGRVFLGRVNKAGTAFLDGKEDITSDFMRALIEKGEYHQGCFEILSDDGRSWTVTVKEDAK